MQITDGMSKTVLIDEIRVGTRASDLRGIWAMGQVGAKKVWYAGSVLIAVTARVFVRILRSPYMTIFDWTSFNVMVVKMAWGATPYNRSSQVTAKSLHPNGVNMCSGRWERPICCADSVKLKGIYQVMHSRNDGVPVSDF